MAEDIWFRVRSIRESISHESWFHTAHDAVEAILDDVEIPVDIADVVESSFSLAEGEITEHVSSIIETTRKMPQRWLEGDDNWEANQVVVDAAKWRAEMELYLTKLPLLKKLVEEMDTILQQELHQKLLSSVVDDFEVKKWRSVLSSKGLPTWWMDLPYEEVQHPEFRMGDVLRQMDIEVMNRKNTHMLDDLSPNLPAEIAKAIETAAHDTDTFVWEKVMALTKQAEVFLGRWLNAPDNEKADSIVVEMMKSRAEIEYLLSRAPSVTRLVQRLDEILRDNTELLASVPTDECENWRQLLISKGLSTWWLDIPRKKREHPKVRLGEIIRQKEMEQND